MSSHLTNTKKKGINLKKLNLKNSKIFNNFVLNEYCSWGRCTEVDVSDTAIFDNDILSWGDAAVDVSDTAIFDNDILSIAFNCGKNLEKLVLKGCNKLTMTSIHHLGHYATGLLYLGLWDASEETLFQLSKLKVIALDLAFCANVSNRVLESLHGVQYLDLSCVKAEFERKSIIRFAVNNATTLLALDLSRPQPTFQEDQVSSLYDDATMAGVFNAAVNLTHLDLVWSVQCCSEVDLTYCQKCFKVGRGQQTQAMEALSNLKKLETLVMFDVPVEAADFARTVGLLSSLKNLITTRINFPNSNSSKSPRAPLASTFINELSQRTFQRLIIQNMATMSDGFTSILKVSQNALIELDISGGVLLSDNVANSISNCTKLTSLSIEGCPFSEAGIEKIINNCLNLIIVNFGGTNVTDKNLRSLLVDIPTSHPTKKSLHTLQISGCMNLTKDSLQNIQTQKNLKVLKLSRSPFVNQDNLIVLVQACSKLNYLDVSNCQNMPKQEEPIKQLLQDLVELLPTAFIRIQLHGKVEKKI